jgi:tyrosine-protein kinase Etk/Wzc
MYEEEIDLKEYLRIIQKRKWIIFSVVPLITIIGIIISFAITPVYQGETSLLVDTKKSGMPSFFEFADFSQGDEIQTQCEIVKSRSVVERAVNSLGLHEREAEYNGFVKNLFTFLRIHDTSFGKWAISFMKGLVGNKEKKKNYTPQEKFRKKVEEVMKNLSVKSLKKTDLIVINFNANSPALAAEVANRIALEYIELSLSARRGEAKSVKDFVNNQLNIRENELRDFEKKLRTFKEENGIVNLSEEVRINLERQAEFKKSLEEVLIERRALKIRIANIEEDLKKQEKHIVSQSTLTKNPILDSLKTQKIELDLKLQRLLSDGLTPQHPEVKKAKAEIDQTIEKIKNEESKVFGSKVYTLNEIYRKLESEAIEFSALHEALAEKQEGLQKICDTYDKGFDNLPLKELEYLRIQRDIKVTEEIFIMLSKKKEEARISEAMEIGNIRIIDSAISPEKPIKPRKTLNALISMILGFMLGLGLAFVIEFFDTSFKSADDVEKNLNIAVLGSIPFMEGMDDAKENEDAEDGYNTRLITENNPKSPVSESYRSLRTNIQFVNIDKKIETLLVTSAGPSEGKSTTIANLAITAAQQGHKTLLVDGDLRKPMIHNIFNLKRTQGITNVLANGVDEKTVIQPSGIDNLSILPTGPIPPNPSELLGSQKMEDLLARLKKDYSLVLVDAPPILAVTDAAVVSPKLDGILMVIHSAKTDRDSAKRAKALLEHVGGNMIGVVLNAVSTKGGYGNYYYYYYTYYGADGTKHDKRSGKKDKTSKSSTSKNNRAS